jgi:hypothetical integral membrane protein (TIGR02206 family)
MEFHSFSLQHFGILFALALITYVLIVKGRRAKYFNQRKMAILLATLIFLSEITEAIVMLINGQYDYRMHLPLFLCDISALMLPFVIFYHNRKWIGILYFWAMAGTLQALITPDLDQGFPSFEYFRYFFMHGGIVITILFTVIVFKIRIRWQDLINAVLYAQVYLVLIHLVNLAFHFNYSYTIAKPPGPTVLDLFGPWPWYILWGEVLMIVLFLVLITPFLFTSQLYKPEREAFEGH